MAWIYLLLAGIAEWGWPMGLKFPIQKTRAKQSKASVEALC